EAAFWRDQSERFPVLRRECDQTLVHDESEPFLQRLISEYQAFQANDLMWGQKLSTGPQKQVPSSARCLERSPAPRHAVPSLPAAPGLERSPAPRRAVPSLPAAPGLEWVPGDLRHTGQACGGWTSSCRRTD
ncbi:hypothetical protein CYMTET_33754, partial [Cymbomonas tetramitiformis]